MTLRVARTLLYIEILRLLLAKPLSPSIIV